MIFLDRHGTGLDSYILVHGWAGDHRTFKPLVPYAPPEASLCALDLPGWGQSPPPKRWDLAEYADALKEAVDATNGSPVTLVGYCGGANLCLEALWRGLEPVQRLVMIDPFVRAPWYLKLFTRGEFGRRAYFSTFASPMGRRITNAAMWHKREPGQDVTRGFADIDHEVALRFLCMLCEREDVDRFRGLVANVDIVYGRKTFGAVKKSVPEWLDVFPCAGVYELPGAAHEPIRQSAREVAAVIFRTAQSA
ncbi:MAG TPA: alpha/beta hydrolase [Candidatus Bathyarchaeia archaeon]|nr:alpha/beta hydrolase [Candidatus Bathyarchaeia archaeon]